MKRKYIEAMRMAEKLEARFVALTATHPPELIQKWESEYQHPMPTCHTKPLIDCFQCNFNNISMFL